MIFINCYPHHSINLRSNANATKVLAKKRYYENEILKAISKT